MLALFAGWSAHFVPQDVASTVSASGTLTTLEPSAVEVDDSQPSDGPSSGPLFGSADPTTAFRTACGELLDVVPTAAVASGLAVRIALEVRPVCPTGEWIASSQVRINVTDVSGATLAVGDFDFSADRLYVPGFEDPTTTLEASFGPGTAWAAPELLAMDIANGSVIVDCRPLDGSTGEPAEPEEAPTAAIASKASPPNDRAAILRTAEEALRRQALADDPSVSELEGAWVPQLSSKRDGIYDDYTSRTYDSADIYQQYLQLRLRYPEVRVLSSTDWNSYELDDYWVVIAGIPFRRPGEPNRWCSVRDIVPSQCFAKRLIRDGAPSGTTKHRD